MQINSCGNLHKYSEADMLYNRLDKESVNNLNNRNK